MKLLISAVLIAVCGCSAIQIKEAEAILKTCGVPAAEKEAAALYNTVLAIVENQPVNWKEQLVALETTAKTGVLCSLQQIANGQMGTTPTVRLAPMDKAADLIFAFPPAKASANAKAYLSAHK